MVFIFYTFAQNNESVYGIHPMLKNANLSLSVAQIQLFQSGTVQ